MFTVTTVIKQEEGEVLFMSTRQHVVLSRYHESLPLTKGRKETLGPSLETKERIQPTNVFLTMDPTPWI